MRSVHWMLVLAAAAGAGCNSAARLASEAPAVVDHIDRVSLWAAPMAINWDREPAPDGVSVRVYLYRLDGSEVRTARGRGELELELFEGADEQALAAAPANTWRFTAAQLEPFFARDSYGLWCYQMGLSWGERVPAAASVTLLARYLDKTGLVVVSAPATILMQAH